MTKKLDHADDEKERKEQEAFEKTEEIANELEAARIQREWEELEQKIRDALGDILTGPRRW